MRHWCWTLHGVEEMKDPAETALKELLGKTRYTVWQKEVAGSGAIHLQGYSEFSAPIRLTALKRLLPSAHWEARRGSREQARDYCKKDATRVLGEEPHEHGVWNTRGAGNRTDLQGLYQDIKAGKSLADLQELHTNSYLRLWRGIDKMRSNLLTAKHSKRGFVKVSTTVYWGATGVGKSRRVLEAFPDAYIVETATTQGQVWWDNYEGEDVILFDDFYGGVKHAYLLRLLDGYRMQLPTKGAHTWKGWTKVFITSNKPPQEWYKDPKGWPALERRLDVVEEMNEGNYVDLTEGTQRNPIEIGDWANDMSDLHFD